jgi:LysM repeat protein
MRRLRPARFLAPLALFACALAIWLIVKPAGDTGSAASGTSTATTSTTTGKRHKPSSGSGKKRSTSTSGKTYTVKSGDTLSGIAQTTGKTVQQLLDLNTSLDANTMQVGQKIKLGG